MRLAVVVAITFGCGSRPPPPPSTPSIETVELATKKHPRKAMFGRTDDAGRFMNLSEVTLAPGVVFGWRLELPCSEPVLYKETMLLPTPGDWTFTPETLPETTIGNGGRTATTNDYVACRNGWIEHTWRVAKGDPPGPWVITIEIDGYEPVVFRTTFVVRR